MSLERTEIGGVPCWHRRVEASSFIRARRRIGHSDVCPICRKVIGEEGQLYMFLNNFKLFPNTICHAACVDERGLEEAARFLAEDYAKAKAAIEGAWPWFGGRR